MKRLWLVLLACGTMSGPVVAQYVGVVDSGDNALEIAQKIQGLGGWNQGGGACRVKAEPGGAILEADARCPVDLEGKGPLRRVTFDIKVTSPGGKLVQDHCFSFLVFCDNDKGRLVSQVEFSPLPLGGDPEVFCQSPRTCGPNTYPCFFPYGEINVTVDEGKVSRIDLLGTTGAIALTLGLLGIGLFFLLRRGFAVAAARS